MEHDHSTPTVSTDELVRDILRPDPDVLAALAATDAEAQFRLAARRFKHGFVFW